MGDERVETLVHRICWDRLDLEKLRSTITDTLTDDVLIDDDIDEYKHVLIDLDFDNDY